MKRKRNPKLKVSSYILSILALCFLIACSNRPSYVLSEKQLEDVLYDVYIAEAIIKQNQTVFHRDTLLKQELLKSVLDKHHINPQKFDTTMIWYANNLDKFVKINDKLEHRYTLDIEKMRVKSEAEKKEEKQVFDSTYLYAYNSFILQKETKETIFSFMVSDYDLLNTNKRYHIDFLAIGIKAPDYPILTFSIACQDTILVYKDTIKTNSWYSNSYAANSERKVNSVYGTIHLPANNTNAVLLHDFRITQQKKKIITGEEVPPTPKFLNRKD